MKSMQQASAVWYASLQASFNALRQDRRLQVALGLVLVFESILGVTSIIRLQGSIQQWQAAGPMALTTGFWTLCLSVWAGSCFFALIGTLQTLRQERTLLLLTLPLRFATLFRTLYGTLFLENLRNWLPLQAIILGYVLLPRLHWQALPWLLLIDVGCGAFIFVVLVTVLLFIRYLLPREQTKTRIYALCLPGIIGVLLIFFATKLFLIGKWLVLWLRPEYVLILCGLVLIGGLGPLAGTCGKLAGATIMSIQGWDRSRTAFMFPGTGLLRDIFARRRTLTGALFVRAVMNQSRNIITWLRLVYALVILLLLPTIHTLVARSGLSDSLFVIMYTSTFTLLPPLETAPNAISGEGDRFALYLTAPLTFQQILRAKLLLFLLPLLIEGLIGSSLLGIMFTLRPGQVVFVMATTALIVIGMTALLVFGSAWDLDLQQSTENAMQLFLQEEGPFSPRRITLLGLALLCIATMFLLLWKLPAFPALIALLMLDGTILLSMRKLSNLLLHQLLRNG